MNTRSLVLSTLAFLALPGAAWAGRSEFSYTAGRPVKKRPVEVLLRRNPFQATAEPERPLPVLRDKDDPALKVPGLVAAHLRSVIRDTRGLVLLDQNVFQAGDEIRFGREPVLANFRVVLKTIEDDRLVFHLTSLDAQQPGQVEAFLPLGPAMRKN